MNPLSPDSPIIFTLAAAQKVKSLIDEEGNPLLNLRVFITGGGCSGFQYGFTFDDKINEDDIIIEKRLDDDEEDEDGDTGEGDNDEEEDDGGTGTGTAGSGIGSVKLLVDSMSFQYLKGAKIGYREDVNGAQFVISGNPNAKTTCGCGSSFSA